MAKKVGQNLRKRLHEKLNFLNEGQFNTLADQQMQPGMPNGQDEGIYAGNIEVGASFE